MNKPRRFLAPTTLICALALALALAATAAAETRSGEATSPVNEAIPGKADILSASASYDTAGKATFNMTTREAPGEKQEFTVTGFLGRPSSGGTCQLTSVTELPVAPFLQISAQAITSTVTVVESPPTWLEFGEDMKISGVGLATKSIAGTTTTFIAKSDEQMQNKPFSCASVIVQSPQEIGESGELKPSETLDEVSFLLSNITPTPIPPAPAVPAPAALSLAKLKPVSAKAGKWTKVKVKVTNTGGTSVGPITVKAKAPAGVVLKPGSGQLKLPALLGGQTWTATLQVKLTEKAKSKSTISLTGTAAGLTAGGSVVVKAAG
jgi:hypothetical protein